jgi:hypothetical protein
MGRVTKNFVLQWGEMPTSVAYIGTGQIMGWGNKAIEVIKSLKYFINNHSQQFSLNFRYDRLRQVIWMAFSCIKKLNALNSCANVTTKSSSVAQKVDHLVRYIL